MFGGKALGWMAGTLIGMPGKRALVAKETPPPPPPPLQKTQETCDTKQDILPCAQVTMDILEQQADGTWSTLLEHAAQFVQADIICFLLGTPWGRAIR